MTPQVEITRTFDAPKELVWDVFTKAEHLKHWWGPKGANIEIKKFAFQPGGVFHYNMEVQPGNKLWGKFVYDEINPKDNFSFRNSFSDENEGLTDNPWIPVWPKEVQNIWSFEEQDGKTVATLKAWPVNASDAEVDSFAKAKSGMEQGFTGTFMVLDEYLASIK